MNLELGGFLLAVGWCWSVYALAASFCGAWSGDERFVRSGARGLLVAAMGAVASFCVLLYYFLQCDFRFVYVLGHSSADMEAVYRLAAAWGGMEGSMLLWVVMLALYTIHALCRLRQVEVEDALGSLRPWVYFYLALPMSFFMGVVAFLTNPFRQVPYPGFSSGQGLNPLLQNPYMLIHPPLLYAGLNGLVLPYAFALASLTCQARLFDRGINNRQSIKGQSVNGRRNSPSWEYDWVVHTRKVALFAWGALTAGIVLGGYWAYLELGWGGFWAWDPVENASFFPWLTATAFLHSSLLSIRQRRLNTGVFVFALSSYLLTVFGTFLTRSGVVQSVHAFTNSGIGGVFLGFIAGNAFLLLVLLWRLRWRLHGQAFFAAGALGSGGTRADTSRVSVYPATICGLDKLGQLVSLPRLIFLGNLLLSAICVFVLIGVLTPVVTQLSWIVSSPVSSPVSSVGNLSDLWAAEPAAGAKSVDRFVLGTAYYNAIVGPLFLLILGVMALVSGVLWTALGGADDLSGNGGSGRSSGTASKAEAVEVSGVDSESPESIAGARAAMMASTVSLAIALAIALAAGLVVVFIKHGSVYTGVGTFATVFVAFSSLASMAVPPWRLRPGAISHAGLALMGLAIVLAWSFQVEEDVVIRVGEQKVANGHRFAVSSLTESFYPTAKEPTYAELTAHVRIIDPVGGITDLRPRYRYYFASKQPSVEVDIATSAWRDIYLAFAGVEEERVEVGNDGEALKVPPAERYNKSKLVFKFYINPFQVWLWIGALLLLSGVGISLFRKGEIR